MVITQSILYTPAFGLKSIHSVDADHLISAPNAASESTDSSSWDIRVGGRHLSSRISPVNTFISPTFWFAYGPILR